LFDTTDLSEANAVNKFPCLKQFLGDQQFRLKVVRALGDRLRGPQDKAFIEAVAQAISELGRSDADGLALLVDVYKRLVALNSQNAEYAGTYAVATMLFEAREKEFFDDLEALINAASAAAAIGALIIALGTGIGEIVIAIGVAVRAAQSLGELLQWLASRGYLPAF
jgi:glycyl-tRNA synthetase beta subunit